MLNPSNDWLRQQAEEERREHIIQAFGDQARVLDLTQRTHMETELRRQVVHGDPPKTAEELHDAIYALTGMTIPYTVADPEHTSPFEAMWRLYKGHWEKSLWWASRESGKTYLGTLAHFLIDSFNKNHESLHAGGVTRQAEIASATLQSFSRDPALRLAFEGEVGARKAKFVSGSIFTIAPGKYRSIDGQHPNFLSCDEIKHWGIKDLNQVWGIPSSKNGYLKRLLFSSTNQDAGGGFNYILEEAPKRNIHVALWTVFETMQPCRTCIAEDQVPYPAPGDEGDNQREKVCALWKVCRGIKAKKVTGWKPRQEVCEFVISLGGADSDEAKTQAFCQKPSTRGLVLHNFEHAPRKDGGNWTTMVYDREGMIPFLVSIDPAESNKCAIGFWHYYQGVLYQFDELIIENCASPMEAKAKFYEYITDPARKYRDPEVIVFDPGKPDAISDWRYGTPDGEGINRRYNAIPCPKKEEDGGQEVEVGLREVRAEINTAGIRKLFINPDKCPKTITAIKNWMYSQNIQDGEIRGTAKPKEIFKDEGDMIRYMVRYKRVKLDSRSVGLTMFDG